jgi:hypothetical protein
VATRRNPDGDTTLTVPPAKSVDQMRPSKATIRSGVLPTGTLAVIFPDSG